MQTFFHAVSSVLVIVLMTATGYFSGARGWIKREYKPFFTKFIINFAIPCTCINGLTTNLSRDMLHQGGVLLLVPFLGIVLCLVISLTAAQLLRLPRRRFGVFVLMGGVSNAIFIGLAMCQELFGNECVPYVMFYYLSNTLVLQSVGFGLVEYAGSPEGTKFGLRGVLSVFKKPPVISLAVGLLLLELNVQLPAFLSSFLRYMSGTVSPLAMLYIGFTIYELGLKNIRVLRGLPTLMVIRFVLSPAISLGLCAAFGVTGLARSVFAAEMAMPVVTQSVVMAGEFGADEEYAVMGAALTTLLTFAVMPVLMLLL